MNDYPNAKTNRRHFLKHVAGATSLILPAITLTRSIRAHASQLSRDRKAAILLWLGGGPSSIDMWDMKPNAPTGGTFKPISTTGDLQICEHLPLLAKQMSHLSVVRSMSTREADHNRGSYYMHTGFVPNPSVQHPSYGALVAHELIDQRPELEIPPFVAVGSGSVGPGFLGMSWSPFVVNADGRVRDVNTDLDADQLQRRLVVLNQLEQNFIKQQRGTAAEDHSQIVKKTVDLMTSDQMAAFNVRSEPESIREQYGDSDFGRGCLLARRLVEAGVPFVEVDFGGWDNHQNLFPTLENQRLPVLDKAFSALVEDLRQRGLYENTAIICMGEFGRTPAINARGGRDHWARAWSVVVGGAGFAGGRAIGSTNDDGTAVTSEAYAAEDLMASVCDGAGDRTAHDFYQPQRPPHENRQRRESDQAAVGLERRLSASRIDTNTTVTLSLPPFSSAFSTSASQVA